MKNPIISQHRLGPTWDTENPFMFCAYHKDTYPPGNERLGLDEEYRIGRPIGQDFQLKDGFRMYHGSEVPGFPAHPHSGFETITIVRSGYIDHSDSLGASARFGEGDVQWMTAGKGIQHAEMFPLLNSEKSNALELFQIWLNLPEAQRHADPHFQMMWSKDIPHFSVTDSAGKKCVIELIAGQWDEHRAPAPPPNSWAAEPAHGLNIWHISLESKAAIKLPTATAEVNRQLFFYSGTALHIAAAGTLESGRSVRLLPDVPTSIVNGNTPARLLLLQSVPIEEKSVQHGPFVAGSRDGLIKAMQRFQNGAFGRWPWKDHEPVHDKSSGRFARYPDGTLAEPE